MKKYIAIKKCKNCEWFKDHRCPRNDFRLEYAQQRIDAVDEVKRSGHCAAWMPLRAVG